MGIGIRPEWIGHVEGYAKVTGTVEKDHDAPIKVGLCKSRIAQALRDVSNIYWSNTLTWVAVNHVEVTRCGGSRASLEATYRQYTLVGNSNSREQETDKWNRTAHVRNA